MLTFRMTAPEGSRFSPTLGQTMIGQTFPFDYYGKKIPTRIVSVTVAEDGSYIEATVEPLAGDTPDVMRDTSHSDN